mmetsp:Transcript_1403/g.2848  ORF Transcript_1403/g.2848 Transcript_1403/m.2848 type:complete len:347 (-) Transcript_1403:1664-2704(-)
MSEDMVSGEDDDWTLEEEEAEQQHLESVIHAFEVYGQHCLRMLKRKEGYFGGLPEEDQEMMVEMWRRRMASMEECVEANAAFLKRAVMPNRQMFENSRIGPGRGRDGGHATLARNEGGRDTEEALKAPGLKSKDSLETHMDKVRCILRQLVREWSAEGRAERAEAFAPLCEAIVDAFESGNTSGTLHRRNFRVLVPGAGLGRLAWELASRGFSTQGNEFSYFCLLLSNQILNHSTKHFANIFPYVTNTNNVHSWREMVRGIAIPDVDPSVLDPKVEFSMCAGEFLAAYKDQQESFNAIATCFFIDTAHNILAYIRRFYQLLKPVSTPHKRWLGAGRSDNTIENYFS